MSALVSLNLLVWICSRVNRSSFKTLKRLKVIYLLDQGTGVLISLKVKNTATY